MLFPSEKTQGTLLHFPCLTGLLSSDKSYKKSRISITFHIVTPYILGAIFICIPSLGKWCHYFLWYQLLHYALKCRPGLSGLNEMFAAFYIPFNSNVFMFWQNSLASLGKLQQLQKAMELLNLPQGAPKSMEEAKRKQYQFWDTQPVPKLGN